MIFALVLLIISRRVIMKFNMEVKINMEELRKDRNILEEKIRRMIREFQDKHKVAIIINVINDYDIISSSDLKISVEVTI